MHIPWGWSKQRPQFIAEELSHHFDITVLSIKNYGSKRVNDIPLTKTLKIYEPFRLPFERFSIIFYFNTILYQLYFKFLFRNHLIWITDPRIYERVISVLPKEASIIYDCMDDVLEFNLSAREKEKLYYLEKKLVQSAQFIFCSSKTLLNRIGTRYGKEILNKSEVVNNALSEDLYKMYTPASKWFEIKESINQIRQDGQKIYTYIGTISHWFDFNLLLESLEENKDLSYFLFGHTDVDIPTHPRIHFFGAIEHSMVGPVMALADVLIMPFSLTPLIESVDAVKIYEYIASGKPVVCLKYYETEKFGAFLIYYDSAQSYIVGLKNALTKNALSEQKKINFTKQNIWEKRIIIMKKKIESLYI